jgi:heterotetrameric sarcosine oxidase gamma subunit
MAELAWSGVLERTAVCAPGEAFVEAAGLHVRVVEAAQFILACHLRPGAAAPPQALQDAIAGVAGQPLPLAPNTRSGGDGEYAVWLDPGRWLAVGASAQRFARLGAWHAAVTGAAPEASVSDASDALVVLEIGGARAPALMAMACALDIAAAFAPPRTARTGFAGVSALLYRHGNGFRAHVDATLLAHAREWLGQAARLLPRDGQ